MLNTIGKIREQMDKITEKTEIGLKVKSTAHIIIMIGSLLCSTFWLGAKLTSYQAEIAKILEHDRSDIDAIKAKKFWSLAMEQDLLSGNISNYVYLTEQQRRDLARFIYDKYSN